MDGKLLNPAHQKKKNFNITVNTLHYMAKKRANVNPKKKTYRKQRKKETKHKSSQKFAAFITQKGQ